MKISTIKNIFTYKFVYNNSTMNHKNTEANWSEQYKEHTRECDKVLVQHLRCRMDLTLYNHKQPLSSPHTNNSTTYACVYLLLLCTIII